MRPFWQNCGREPKLLVGRHISGTITHLRTLDVERPDLGLDVALRFMPVLDNPPTPIRQGLFGMLCDEGLGFGPKCRGLHPARAITGDLGQRVINRF